MEESQLFRLLWSFKQLPKWEKNGYDKLKNNLHYTCSFSSFSALPLRLFVMICMDSNEKRPRRRSLQGTKVILSVWFWGVSTHKLRQSEHGRKGRSVARDIYRQAPGLGFSGLGLATAAVRTSKRVNKKLSCWRTDSACFIRELQRQQHFYCLSCKCWRGRGVVRRRGVCIEAGHTVVCLAAFVCILFAYNLTVYGRQEQLPASPHFPLTLCGLALWQAAGPYIYVYLLFVFIDFQVKTLLRSAKCPMCAWPASITQHILCNLVGKRLRWVCQSIREEPYHTYVHTYFDIQLLQYCFKSSVYRLAYKFVDASTYRERSTYLPRPV